MTASLAPAPDTPVKCASIWFDVFIIAITENMVGIKDSAMQRKRRVIVHFLFPFFSLKPLQQAIVIQAKINSNNFMQHYTLS